MVNIQIDKERCKGCCLCVSECPRGNIAMSRLLNSSGQTYAEIIDLNDCTACALCCQMCPELAIVIDAADKAPAEPPVKIQETTASEQASADKRHKSGVRSG